jgi:hypothetical protein
MSFDPWDPNQDFGGAGNVSGDVRAGALFVSLFETFAAGGEDGAVPRV